MAMKPADFKRWRKGLGLSQKEAAEMLGLKRRMVQYYDGVPVGVNDFIADDQVVGESEDCSTIYALQLGEGAVAGLTGPGPAGTSHAGE